MIGVRGIGWVDGQGYGGVRQDTYTEYADRESFRKLGKTDGLFNYPVKNFGRFETITQRVCYAVALALRDAGIEYAEGVKQDIGLLGTSPDGCVESNINYFKDYVEGGRSLSRANLFIYTLPTSPFAEAAVHFGLLGPLLYGSDFAALATMAQGMVQRKEVSTMLLSVVDANAGFCLAAMDTDDALCGLDQIILMNAESASLTDFLRKVRTLNEN